MKKYNQFLLFSVPILCILGLVLSLKRSYFADEGWYLLTLSRMMSGDTLYRDIFSHVTPLGHYIGLIFTYVFGIEIWSLRIATLLIFIGTVLLIFRIFQKLSLGIPYQVSAAIIIMMYDPPGLDGSGTLYTPLGKLFYLFCFDLALLWLLYLKERTGRQDKGLYAVAVLAGLSAGLAFVSKQNMGIYAITALFLCIMSKRPFYLNIKRHIPHLLTIGISFVSILVVFLAPTYFDDAIFDFIDFTILAPRLYIEYAAISYWYQIKVLAYYIRQTITVADPAVFFYNLRNIFTYTMFLLPPVTCILLIGSIFLSKQETRQTAFFILFFGLFGFMGAYPRFDLSHVGSTVPMLTIALLYACHRIYQNLPVRWERFKMELSRLARASVVMWTLIWILMVSYDFHTYITGPYRISTIPHFRGLIVSDVWHEEVKTGAGNLTKFVSDSQVFILHQHAPLYYLATGMENILPFDSWTKATFGLNGQQRIIDTINRGQIQVVYLEFLEGHTPLAAEQLEHFIRDNMVEDKTWEGSGHIYRTGTDEP
jgi:4-amino-4-deoxy-L-arabinose transferase-like glycosyltransferase